MSSNLMLKQLSKVSLIFAILQMKWRKEKEQWKFHHNSGYKKYRISLFCLNQIELLRTANSWQETPFQSFPYCPPPLLFPGNTKVGVRVSSAVQKIEWKAWGCHWSPLICSLSRPHHLVPEEVVFMDELETRVSVTSIPETMAPRVLPP